MTNPPGKERRCGKRRTKRAPSLGRALKQLRAAGENPRTARQYSDHIEFDLNEPEGEVAVTPLDEWRAKRRGEG